MKKNFKIVFNEENKLLYKYYYGVITLDDIQESWLHAIENDRIPSNVKGFILDYRHATVNLKSKDELPKIAEFYKSHPDVFEGQKIAIITENPEAAKGSIEVSKFDEGYESKPFFLCYRGNNMDFRPGISGLFFISVFFSF